MGTKPKPPPPKWGADSLTEFLDIARENAFASFVQLEDEYERLRMIDDLYLTAASSLANPSEVAPALMLLRTHASFRGGIAFVLSLQTPEAYMVMRGCLENSLYAFYLWRHPDAQEIWLRRHDDAASRKKVRKLFSNKRILDELATVDRATAKAASILYERTIDYGAHPNPRSLLSSLHMEESTDLLNYRVDYFATKPEVRELCFKSLAQVGVIGLELYRHVFEHHFDTLGIPEKLRGLKLRL